MTTAFTLALTGEQVQEVHGALASLLQGVERLLSGDTSSDFTPEGLRAIRDNLHAAIATVCAQRDGREIVAWVVVDMNGRVLAALTEHESARALARNVVGGCVVPLSAHAPRST